MGDLAMVVWLIACIFAAGYCLGRAHALFIQIMRDEP
jgi:hypothetical protein